MARTEGPWPKSCVLRHIYCGPCVGSCLPLVFFRCVQSITNSALFSRIPCLDLSRTPYSRLQRPCLRDFHKQPGPQGACWGFGLGLFCFVVFSSSFSRRDVQCFTWIQIQRHSLKCCIAISITLKWEKCKVCFPLICESLGSELAHVL